MPPLPHRADPLRKLFLSGKEISTITRVLPINVRLISYNTVESSNPSYTQEDIDAHHTGAEQMMTDGAEVHFHVAVDNFHELLETLKEAEIAQDDYDAHHPMPPENLVKLLWLILSGGRSSILQAEPYLGEDCLFGVWKGCAPTASD